MSYDMSEDTIRVHRYAGCVLNFVAEDNIKVGDRVICKNAAVVKALPHENEMGIALDDAYLYGTIYILSENN